MQNNCLISKLSALCLLFLDLNGYSQDIDLLIRTNNDSLYCIILEIDHNSVFIKGWLYNDWSDTIIEKAEINTYIYNAVSRKQFIKATGQRQIPDHYDLLVKDNGDSLTCKIIKDNENTLILQTQVKNKWVETWISKDKIRVYHYNLFPTGNKTKYEKPGIGLYLEAGGKLFYSYNIDFPINRYNRISIGGVPSYYEDKNTKEIIHPVYPNIMYSFVIGNSYSNIEFAGGVSIVFNNASPDHPMIGHLFFGYRYQKKKGLLFRAGFTPNFLPKDFIPSAGLSLGYSF